MASFIILWLVKLETKVSLANLFYCYIKLLFYATTEKSAGTSSATANRLSNLLFHERTSWNRKKHALRMK